LESQDGAESTPELPDAPALENTPAFSHANDAGLQAPIQADVSLPEWEAARIQARGLPKLRLL
jgi:hypothetical protein